MAKITVSSIVAMAKNNAIGKNNALLWHISEDLKNFKKITMGKPVIMGRKSYESIGRLLPARPNIIISRAYKHAEDNAPTPLYKQGNPLALNEGPFKYGTVEDAIKAAKDMAEKIGVDEILIIGGGEIYKETLPMIEKLYLTMVDGEYEADTFFPEWKPHEWHTVSKEQHEGNPSFTFFVLERKT